ncbi:hypothetical protein [Streptomyces sp. NPDC051776]|uniref:hypothetical protein n=1 Tax=Streptomyces sp. NPDC051776 TaxID=3155414 RepID=UPI0034417972
MRLNRTAGVALAAGALVSLAAPVAIAAQPVDGRPSGGGDRARLIAHPDSVRPGGTVSLTLFCPRGTERAEGSSRAGVVFFKDSDHDVFRGTLKVHRHIEPGTYTVRGTCILGRGGDGGPRDDTGADMSGGNSREDSGSGMGTGREDSGSGASTGREDSGSGASTGREDSGSGMGTGREDSGSGLNNGREDSGSGMDTGRADVGSDMGGSGRADAGAETNSDSGDSGGGDWMRANRGARADGRSDRVTATTTVTVTRHPRGGTRGGEGGSQSGLGAAELAAGGALAAAALGVGIVVVRRRARTGRS